MDAGASSKTGFMPAFALEPIDDGWRSTLSRSLPGRLWTWLKSLLPSETHPLLARAGTILQLAAFWLVLALALALGLPQFASDKEGLAVFVVVALALRLAGTLLGGKEIYKSNAVDMLVLVYLAVYVIATAASHYLIPSVKGLAKVVVYVAGYFLFTGALSVSRRRISATVACLVAAGFAVALYGLYQYKIGVAPLATWEDPTVEVKATRIYSTLGNPNLLAGYLIPLVPLSLSLALASAWTKRLWLAIPIFGVSGVLVLATLLTGSRGGYIGLAGALGVFGVISACWIWSRMTKLRPLIVAGVLALPAVLWALVQALPSFQQRFMSIFAGREHTSNSFRLNVWQSSWNMFTDNWWIGVGPGNKTFRLAYGLYMKSGFDALGTYCVPLEVAVEAGIPGLLAFGAIVAAVLARGHQAFWQAEDPVKRWLVVGLVSALAGLLAHGLVDTVFFRPQVHLIFWMCISGVVALHAQDR